MPLPSWLIGLDLENLFQQCPLTRRMFVPSDLDIALLEIGVNERTGERQDGQRTDDTKRDASAVHCRRRSKNNNSSCRNTTVGQRKRRTVDLQLLSALP